MTFAEFLANPMAPLVIALLLIMAGFVIAMFWQSEDLTAFEKEQIAHRERVAKHHADTRAKLAAQRADLAARRAAFDAKYNVQGK